MENINHTLEENIIGDIAISVEMADYEAKISGCTFSERLVELIIHGLVHILGFDHETGAKEARRMRYRERKLLKYISQQNVYREFVLKKIEHEA